MTSPRAQYETPGDYLAAADAAFEAGNRDAGAMLLTQSVHSALARIANGVGKPAGTRAELREFVEWLDQKHGTDGWHARNLRTANSFRDNAVHNFLAPEDMELGRPLVRDFVERLLSYQKTDA